MIDSVVKEKRGEIYTQLHLLEAFKRRFLLRFSNAEDECEQREERGAHAPFFFSIERTSISFSFET